MASKERQIERWSKLQHPRPIHLKCIICEYTDLNEKFQKLYCDDLFNAGKLIRHKCPNCSLIFGDLRFLGMNEKEVSDDHDDVYSYVKEGNTVPYILSNLNSLKLFKNKGMSYLDYACGIGSMIPILTNMGYNINGYDKYVKNEHVLNDLKDTKYDVIYTNNFIEHLFNPIADIQNILDHLNDDGYLIMMSDCFDEYTVEYTHYHVYFYTGSSFNILCHRLNLYIIESKTVGDCKIKVLKKVSRMK
jgi:hypothetical protein